MYLLHPTYQWHGNFFLPILWTSYAGLETRFARSQNSKSARLVSHLHPLNPSHLAHRRPWLSSPAVAVAEETTSPGPSAPSATRTSSPWSTTCRPSPSAAMSSTSSGSISHPLFFPRFERADLFSFSWIRGFRFWLVVCSSGSSISRRGRGAVALSASGFAPTRVSVASTSSPLPILPRPLSRLLDPRLRPKYACFDVFFDLLKSWCIQEGWWKLWFLMFWLISFDWLKELREDVKRLESKLAGLNVANERLQQHLKELNEEVYSVYHYACGRVGCGWLLVFVVYNLI